MEFQGKVVLITGAAQGIGAAVAQAMAQQGAKLALFDVQQQALAQQVDALASNGAQVLGIGVNVTDSTAVNAAVERVEQELGHIDVLVNAAGILRLGSALDCSDADWEQTFNVNVGGVFRMCRAVANRMAPRGRGVIVTVASNASAVPRQHMAAYAASKAASAHFTRCLGLELAVHGIRCNVVSPGSTDTAMQRQLWTSEEHKQAVINGALEQFRLGIPLRRIADAADIADAVIFLASERARHITMHELCVDGGATLGA
ncbi:2,3-dihydro-2,3-dihydroxybenzoate dehydrogenase of siderophore biosynthesis [Collimonas arenae]|uniref:2,3-dihydro-2,3-dihydroxybenzoate dehydrogenase n=1 Tax=Collimonas arenae TaxID=279058 RepID=A0A0A1F8W2_9BURK|nr:2,3-dihydro-2,3-dihydroxybenzoate dehydrogenase [Collimonas arenae]AIY40971.1 2,3-dihydro-2,3-dihydroxybenzoate dehydrogenase of siderophore biosynthesis [Collimonas arenae]